MLLADVTDVEQLKQTKGWYFFLASEVASSLEFLKYIETCEDGKTPKQNLPLLNANNYLFNETIVTVGNRNGD